MNSSFVQEMEGRIDRLRNQYTAHKAQEAAADSPQWADAQNSLAACTLTRQYEHAGILSAYMAHHPANIKDNPRALEQLFGVFGGETPSCSSPHMMD